MTQEEAKKLRSEERLHQDLRTKFELVSSELEATKETLANTLQQLADRSSSASAAQSKVVDAERDLEVRAHTAQPGSGLFPPSQPVLKHALCSMPINDHPHHSA